MKKKLIMNVAVIVGMLSLGVLSASAADTFVSETDSTPHFYSGSSAPDKQPVTAALASDLKTNETGLNEQNVYNVSESNSVPGFDNGNTGKHESEVK